MSTPAVARRTLNLVIRVLLAAALAVDAVVHIHLAPQYQQANPGGIGQGNLFYIESGLAILVGLYVLFRGSRFAYFLALLVTASAARAAIASVYVGLPAIGPIPALDEPVWFPEKTLSVVAEGIGAVLAIIGLVVGGRRRR
jgi:hypothetical protein